MTERPVSLTDDDVARGVTLPEKVASPWRRLAHRLGAALAILVGTVLVVYLDSDGYRDANGDGISLSDAIYYVTVTLSTTGYGDIAPATDMARLINAFVVTPARIIFLVLLIGTTLEVLAAESRHELRVSRWRKRMNKHVVLVGYGIKGRSAAATLISSGRRRDEIVVVDASEEARLDALADGHAVVAGDATRREVLSRAGIEKADRVILATERDDTNILISLTIRRMNASVFIAAAVRDHNNAALMKQSGADSVIVSADSAGRMLGSSAVSPQLGVVLEDLITHGEGIEMAQRDALASEVGSRPTMLADRVIAVIRDGDLMYYFEPSVGQVQRGDKLIVVRSSVERPWAPRPGTHGERTSTEDED
ncbi:potassium channel family protein [Austwickia chelonae]|uniref:potassium channel family protein n=1 Tax=Austwickia chelonae TaxID=100225 RepID=UPI000E276F4B|nr:potassium channel family protein [Austwickia chelonae]